MALQEKAKGRKGKEGAKTKKNLKAPIKTTPKKKTPRSAYGLEGETRLKKREHYLWGRMGTETWGTGKAHG